MIQPVQFGAGQVASVSQQVGKDGGTELGRKFGEILQEAMNGIQADERQVNQLNDLFAAGQLPDVHQLMIASEKASLNLELTVQIRNKVIEAYQEIMRTQI